MPAATPSVPAGPVIVYPPASIVAGSASPGAALPVSVLPASASPAGSLDEFVMELVQLAAGAVEVREYQQIRYTLEAGKELRHGCTIGLLPRALEPSLEEFGRRWQTSPSHTEPGTWSFLVTLPPTFWEWLIGRRIGLEMRVLLSAPAFSAAQRSRISVAIRPFGCGRRLAVQLLDKLGPQILASLRASLHAPAEQRARERLAWQQPLRITPVVNGVPLDDAIECVTKDISPGGIGFMLSRYVPSPQIYVNMPDLPQLRNFAGLAHIVRTKPCADGWFEVGAAFALQPQRPHSR